jgi:hypothetical protein
MNAPKLKASAAALGLAALLLFGCKSRQDAAIDQARQQAALTGQPQQVVSVDKYGNTTTTTVQPPVPGQSGQAITTTVTPGPVPVNAGAAPAAGTGYAASAGVPAPSAGVPVHVTGNPGYPAPTSAYPPQTPLPGGAPIVRSTDASIPAGTSLAIRINQNISVKSGRAGDHFDGEVVEPVADASNRVVVPRGTPVAGIIDASHRRGHFKGASILELRLTSMTLNGTRYPLDTHDLTRGKKGKGKRSAAFIGGGTGLGMLVGGVASGGVGLLVGGLAGAGAGTAAAGLTGNRDVEIPSESIVRFRLADDLVVQSI